jgi:hypothetical protein
MTTLERRLAEKGLSLSILRVIDDAPVLDKAGRALEPRAPQP